MRATIQNVSAGCHHRDQRAGCGKNPPPQRESDGVELWSRLINAICSQSAILHCACRCYYCPSYHSTPHIHLKSHIIDAVPSPHHNYTHHCVVHVAAAGRLCPARTAAASHKLNACSERQHEPPHFYRSPENARARASCIYTPRECTHEPIMHTRAQQGA